MEETVNPAEIDELEHLIESWASLPADQRIGSFQALSRPDAEELFLRLSANDQYELIKDLPNIQRRS